MGLFGKVHCTELGKSILKLTSSVRGVTFEVLDELALDFGEYMFDILQ